MSQPIDWKNLQVLIVDDQKVSRDLLREMLGELDVTLIHEAERGDEAMKAADATGGALDIVICDWNMPGMSGLEILKQFRGAEQKLPFLMVTGRNDMDSVMQAKKFGANGYIVKPYSTEQLKTHIERVLKSN
jgi:two-component system, chemotaxis family, chemotaxis protein CheY